MVACAGSVFCTLGEFLRLWFLGLTIRHMVDTRLRGPGPAAAMATLPSLNENSAIDLRLEKSQIRGFPGGSAE